MRKNYIGRWKASDRPRLGKELILAIIRGSFENFEDEKMKLRWLITGSSRGLGRALAEAALAAGHRVVATARNTEELAGLAKQYGERVALVALDVTNAEAADAAVQEAIDAFGGLDVLVNNAGYGNINSVEDRSVEEFRREIETNLFGTIIVTKAAIPVMRTQGSGHILNISSVGGRIGAPGRAAYSAAKFGVEGFSEVLSKEMRLIGVNVTIIEPGGFRTDFAGSSTEINDGRPEYDAVVGATARMQRSYDGKQPGDPSRAANVILDIVQMSNPPLRIPLGSDAVQALHSSYIQNLSELEASRAISSSTDYQ